MMEARAKCRGGKGLWCRAQLCGALGSGGLRHAGARAKQGSVVVGGGGGGGGGSGRGCWEWEARGSGRVQMVARV